MTAFGVGTSPKAIDSPSGEPCGVSNIVFASGERLRRTTFHWHHEYAPRFSRILAHKNDPFPGELSLRQETSVGKKVFRELQPVSERRFRDSDQYRAHFHLPE